MQSLRNLRLAAETDLFPFALACGASGEQAELAARTAADRMIAVYTQEERAYHGLAHAADVAARCRKWIPQVFSSDALCPEVTAAAWFHDAVYSVCAADNEERSAVLLRECFAGCAQGKSEPEAQYSARGEAALAAAERLILITRDHFSARTPEERLLADCDLAMLGETPEKYALYARGVRQEYAHLSEGQYRAGRAAFLREMLRRAAGRGGFYHYLGEEFERRARDNLRREAEILEGGGSG